MNTVEMKKSELLALVRKNRESHRKDFEDALKGFQKEAVRLLEEHVGRARKGLRQGIYVSLECPQDHTRDYDRIILMLEHEVNKTIKLSQQEFAQYAQDDWGWKNQWTLSNSAYIGAARGT